MRNDTAQARTLLILGGGIVTATLLHLGKVAYEKYWLFKWF